jgi:hypothetical protein
MGIVWVRIASLLFKVFQKGRPNWKEEKHRPQPSRASALSREPLGGVESKARRPYVIHDLAVVIDVAGHCLEHIVISATYERRTVLKNLLTSTLSRSPSRESDWAAESTCDDAVPVSRAPRWTSAMLELTCTVP